MPWKEQTVNGAREELVRLVDSEAMSMAACRRFGVSRTCGYKWLKRYRADLQGELAERSRRPVNSPRQTAPPVEEKVVGLCDSQARQCSTICNFMTVVGALFLHSEERMLISANSVPAPLGVYEEIRFESVFQ